MSKNKLQFGFSLVEVIIAIALFSIFATGLMGLLFASYGSDVQAKEKDLAVLYAQEGLDAVLSIRRQAWNLLVNGTHGLTNANSYWEFSGSSEDIDGGYTRTVTVEDGCRDGSGDITDCGDVGASADLNTKKVTVSVSYTSFNFVVNQVDLVAYTTTWQSRDWVQTDWSGGSGQSIWSNSNQYDSDDGNVDTSTTGQVTLATSSGSSCGTNTWPFDDENNYTFNINDIAVTGGVAQLIDQGGGGGGGSGGTVNSGFTSGASSWTYNDWVDSGTRITGNALGSGGNPADYINIVISERKNETLSGYWEQSFTTTGAADTATLDLDWIVSQFDPSFVTSFQLYAFVDSAAGAPTLGQQVWSSGEINSTTSWTSASTVDVSGSLPSAGTYYLKIAVRVVTGGGGGPANGSSIIGYDNVALSWTTAGGGANYPTDEPSINPNSSFAVSEINAWTSFTEDAIKNGGEIYYQLSDDGGSTWYYFDEGGTDTWTTAGATDYNTAAVVNTNIGTFDTAQQQIVFRAFLSSNGGQQIQLDSVSISCAQSFDWPFDSDVNYSFDNSKIEFVTLSPGGETVAQLVGLSSGSRVWDFDDGNNYTYGSDIVVLGSYAELNGTPGSCGGTATPCGDISDSGLCSGSCSWNSTGICENIGSCAAEPRQTCGSSCGAAGCSRSGPNCGNNLECGNITDSTTCSACGQCTWNSTGGSCSGSANSCGSYTDSISCGSQTGCSWTDGIYPDTNPGINPNTLYTADLADSWTSFSENAIKNGGEIYYKLYDGTDWYWYSGGWVTTDSTTLGEYNTASDINSNIASLATGSTDIYFKAFLVSDGTQFVRLNSVTIAWSEGVPATCTNDPGATACSSLSQTDCGTQLGCTWDSGGGSCSTIDSVCSNITTKNECQACGNGCTWSNKNKVCNGTLVCSGVDEASCTDSGACSACSFSGTPASCTDDPGASACSTLNETDCGIQFGCTWSSGGGSYPIDSPSVEPVSSLTANTLDFWSSFTETATKNGGEIYYKLYDGTDWYWYSGSWATTDSTTLGEYNTAADINSNIETLTDFTTSENINFKAFLVSDGSQQIQLDNISISWVERGTCSGAFPVCETHTDQATCEADVVNSCEWSEGSGTGGYQISGNLISSAFDTGVQSSFNIISWSEDVSSCDPNCNIQVQIRTAPDVGGSPGAWSAWYGSSGSGTYFTDPAETLIDTALNFNQWVQYRVELSGDGTETPIFQDITINYTP